MYHLINNVENKSINKIKTPSSSSKISSPLSSSSKKSSPLLTKRISTSSPINDHLSKSTKVLLKSNTTIITTTLTTNTKMSPSNNNNNNNNNSPPIKASTKTQYYHQLSSDVKHSINIAIDRLHYIFNKILLFSLQRLFHMWKQNYIYINQIEEINRIHESYQIQIRKDREYYIQELLKKDQEMLKKDQEHEDNENCMKEYYKLQLFIKADIPKARIFMKILERIYRTYDKKRAWNKLVVCNLKYSEQVLVAAGLAVIKEHVDTTSNITEEDEEITRFEQLQRRIELLSRHPIERIRSIRSLKRIIKRMKTAIFSINRRTDHHDIVTFFHIWKYNTSQINSMEKIEKLQLELKVKDNILSKFEDDIRQEMIRTTPIIEQRARDRVRLTSSQNEKIPTIIKDPNSIERQNASKMVRNAFQNLRLYSSWDLAEKVEKNKSIFNDNI